MSAQERLAFNIGTLPRARRGGERVEPRADVRPGAPAIEPERDTFAFHALLAFMAVLLIRPQDTLPFLSPLHLPDVFGGLGFLAILASRLGRGLRPTRVTPEVLGVIAFAAVMLATVPLSIWPGGSLSVFTDQFGKIVLIFIIIVNTLTTRERVQKYITVVVGGASYVGIRAVFDYARGVNLVEDGRLAGAVGGMFGNPNDMALNMVTFLPLAIALALQKGKPTMRLLGLVGAGTMILAIIFSKSRGGTVGLLAMMAVLLYQMRRIRPGIAVLLVAAGIAALPMLPASFTERMASIFDADQDPTGSREARKNLLKEGWAAFLQHPITGLGAGQFQNYNTEGRVEAWRQTHNAPLQVATEMGIVGAAVFLFLVWTMLMAGVRAQRAARAAAGRQKTRGPTRASDDLEWVQLHAGIITAAGVGWFVAANFASVAYYWTFYLLLGLAGAFRDVGIRIAQAHDRPAGPDARATWGRVA